MDLVEPGCSHQAEVTSATTLEVNVSRKRHLRGREGGKKNWGGGDQGHPHHRKYPMVCGSRYRRVSSKIGVQVQGIQQLF